MKKIMHFNEKLITKWWYLIGQCHYKSPNGVILLAIELVRKNMDIKTMRDCATLCLDTN